MRNKVVLPHVSHDGRPEDGPPEVTALDVERKSVPWPRPPTQGSKSTTCLGSDYLRSPCLLPAPETVHVARLVQRRATRQWNTMARQMNTVHRRQPLCEGMHQITRSTEPCNLDRALASTREALGGSRGVAIPERRLRVPCLRIPWCVIIQYQGRGSQGNCSPASGLRSRFLAARPGPRCRRTACSQARRTTLAHLLGNVASMTREASRGTPHFQRVCFNQTVSASRFRGPGDHRDGCHVVSRAPRPCQRPPTRDRGRDAQDGPLASWSRHLPPPPQGMIRAI